jgi:hypothetical protein
MINIINALISAIGVSKGTRLNDLLHACELIGMDKKIAKDLESVIEERIYMWLLSDIENNLTFSERKKTITQRFLLTNIPIPKDKINPIVELIAESQARISVSRKDRKNGSKDIFSSDQNSLLEKQGFRCVTCGVPLSSSVRGGCGRFPDGLEPISPPVLDHILPFYLGGNDGNYQFLCNSCNALKNDYSGVQEDGISLSGNFLRKRNGEEIKRRMSFWTLWYNRFCGYPECLKGSRETLLWVDQNKKFAPVSYGNMNVFCTDHAPSSAKWIHFDV